MAKSLYELGENPPLGTVPKYMHAAVIRPERYGQPVDAIQPEVVEVPAVGRGQVLVLVMAAGINYNNVWVGLGKPLDVIEMRRRRGAPEEYHIGGSEGAGVVWAVGEGVRHVAVGDHVVLSGCRWDETAPDIRRGVDPMLSTSQTAWGYEENFGSFAQFTLVEEFQCHPKPKRLTWEEAACFLLTSATAYRQLCGWPPHTVQPGDPVLIWGGAGGLGSMAIQITNRLGGRPIAVVSSEDKVEYCKRLGAVGVINRREFDHWGRLPDAGDIEGTARWMAGVRRFGKRIWDILGERAAPKIVFEHAGQDTIPTSIYVADNGGMVVICGGTTGYHADIDLRYLWMRQKRLQGSHFANTPQCRAVISMVDAGQLDPCLSRVDTFADIGKVHQLMYENQHPPGNLAVLVNAPTTGLTSLG